MAKVNVTDRVYELHMSKGPLGDEVGYSLKRDGKKLTKNQEEDSVAIRTLGESLTSHFDAEMLEIEVKVRAYQASPKK